MFPVYPVEHEHEYPPKLSFVHVAPLQGLLRMHGKAYYFRFFFKCIKLNVKALINQGTFLNIQHRELQRSDVTKKA